MCSAKSIISKSCLRKPPTNKYAPLYWVTASDTINLSFFNLLDANSRAKPFWWTAAQTISKSLRNSESAKRSNVPSVLTAISVCFFFSE